MLLNTRIFTNVVETAKAKSANNPAMLRAIDRAVNEINRSKYWAYDSTTNTLRIQSTTSKKLYVVNDAHTCEAKTVCKHKVARRLMQRYAEACNASAIAKETKSAINWHAEKGHMAVEIPRVKVTPIAPMNAPKSSLRQAA